MPKKQKFIGDYKTGTVLRVKFLGVDDVESWRPKQQAWIKENVGKELVGKVVQEDGTLYFRPSTTDCVVLHDDEIKILN